MSQRDAKASTIILQSYGNAKERHVVEVRRVSVTQAWLPDSLIHPTYMAPRLLSLLYWKAYIP